MRWGGVNDPSERLDDVQRRMFRIACQWRGHGELVPAFDHYMRCLDCHQLVCPHNWGTWSEWRWVSETTENRNRICDWCVQLLIDASSSFTLTGVVSAEA